MGGRCHVQSPVWQQCGRVCVTWAYSAALSRFCIRPPPVYARDNDRHDSVSPPPEREERQQPRIGEDNACTREASEQPREEPCVHTVHRDTDREEPRHIDEPFANDTPHQAHACKEAVCEKDFSHNTCSKPSHAGFLGEDWILPLVLFLMLNNQGGGKLKQLLNFQDRENIHYCFLS